MQNTIQKITAKVRCDVLGCKNVAEYFVPSKGLRSKFFLCWTVLTRFDKAAVWLFPSRRKAKFTQTGGAPNSPNQLKINGGKNDR